MRNNRRGKNVKRLRKSINNEIRINKKIIISTIVILVFVMLLTGFALTNSVNETIIRGIKINNIDISKLTINEAYDKVNKNQQQQISKNIKIKQGEYETTISLEQLDVGYDTAEAINEAYRIGRNKNLLISNYEIVSTGIFGKNIKKEIHIDEEELNKLIEDISLKIPDVVVESSYYIEGEQLIISSGKAGIKVKTEELKNSIINAIQNQMKGIDAQTIEIPIEKKQPDPINIEQIKQEIYKEPQNAYYEENPFKLYKEVDGVDFSITIEEAKKLLEEEKEEYIIPLKITKPEILTSNLQYGDFFPEQLSKYSTRYDESNLNRSNNIKLASEKINGKIIMPGETFSYNKTVGKRTIEDGYKEASIYMNGKVVNGIGGGICQLSTTLYNAVLEANLEIVERKNHSFITSYVPASRDATVSYGTIDFKFKNTRSYPIKLECSSKNGICQVSINGIQEETEYEVVIQDEITEVIPYTTKYIDTNTLEKGVENETQKGVNGYKSEAYRILKLNGQVVSKTLLSKDSYNPLQQVIERGTKVTN